MSPNNASEKTNLGILFYSFKKFQELGMGSQFLFSYLRHAMVFSSFFDQSDSFRVGQSF